MATKTFTVTLLESGGMNAIPVPFDPKMVFGKVRAPVVVELNGYRYRSTVARMKGETFVPLRKSHRQAAGISAGDTITVSLTLDTEERTVEVPQDLAAALKQQGGCWQQWQALSYTLQRESVESVLAAKKPETRARRIDKIVALVASKQD